MPSGETLELVATLLQTETSTVYFTRNVESDLYLDTLEEQESVITQEVELEVEL